MTHPDILKAATGGLFALASWSAGQLAQAVDAIPPWIKAADTPLVVLGLGYGIIHLWRELRSERQARINDRDSFIATLRDDSGKAAASRETLVRAAEQQTAEFKALRREISRGKIPHSPDDES